MINKLVDAFDRENRKRNRAEKIEGKYQDKRNKMAVKVSRAKNIEQAEKRQGKIRTQEEKAYKKMKKIESSGVDLGESAKQFVKMYEKEQEMKKVRPSVSDKDAKYYGSPVKEK